MQPHDPAPSDLTTWDSTGESPIGAAPPAAAALRPAAIVPAGPAWLRAAALGLAGALIAGAIWATVAVITDLEVGYIAVLVGGLTGLGVRLGARRPGGAPLQMLAVAMAVLGLVAARYMTFAWIAARELDVSPFDPMIATMFPHFIGELLSPFDALWLFLAVGAAVRTAAPAPE